MRTTRSLALIVILLLLLGGCATKALDKAIKAGGKMLSGAELTALVAGNTLKLEEYGATATVECFLNGKLAAVNNEDVHSTGRWRVDAKDRLCLNFSRLGGNEVFCSTVYQVGDQYRQFTDNGALYGTFSVITGNSQTPPDSSGQVLTHEPAPTTKVSRPTAPLRQEQPPAMIPAQPPEEHHADTDIRFFYLQMAQDCPGCNLAAISLEGARLINANLAGADLRKANLGKANLQQANLRGANLSGINLREANLAGADLAGANLAGADLTNANLTRAIFTGADLSGAIGAELSNAIH